jgi:hypothetical protein
MYSFETVLVGPLDDKDAQREQIAQQMGINVTQLVCSFGFNPDALKLAGVVNALGYASVSALVGERNYLFIHDRYHGLTINNILDIYSVIGRSRDDVNVWSDLVMSRLTNIEGQLEETINPVLIGGYKLEVRAIYEQHLASSEFVDARLQAGYEVLRDIANEAMIMLETKAITPEQFIASTNVTIDEKCRGVFQGLITQGVVESHVSGAVEEAEKRRLLEALEGRSGA